MPIATELNVNTSATAMDMANAIFGNGVTVQTATYTGAGAASGTYTGALSTLGALTQSDTGVILSTGNATDFTNSSGTTDTNTAAGTSTDHTGVGEVDGDTALDAVSGQATEDGAFFEADFIADHDLLTMQFVFTSEEYLEYVNGGVNDAIGVWVNGTYVPLTLADGSTQNVTIDTINDTSASNLYVDNPAASDPYNTEMDGGTVVLSFTAAVNAGATNTIRIGIGDGGDSAYDSNLLIMGNSVQTVSVAESDQLIQGPNIARTHDLLSNDINHAGNALTISHINNVAVSVGDTVTLPSGEQITLNADGTVDILTDGDIGTNNFTYSTIDSAGNSSTGFATIETASGIVDGTSAGDFMSVGYTDANGDIIDGVDGINDTIHGYAGDDTIQAGSGNDTVYGGLGDDVIQDSAGADSVLGGAGNDTIHLISGADTVDGGAGRDTFISQFNASTTDATVIGGEGGDDFDVLTYSGEDADPLNVGFTGDEAGTVDIGTATVTFSEIEGVVAGQADDTINAAADSSGLTLDGQAGADAITGGSGNDSILGGTGADTLDAGAGDDTVRGGFGNDTIIGGAGNDSLVGNEDDDSITGGIGSDSLYGELGNDVASGGDGNDTVEGNEGNDTLYGGAGDDWMRGSYDNDELWGGTGDDYLWGGWGDDVFYLEDNFGNDTVDAEGVAETGGDTLDLSNVTSGLTVDLTHVNPENGSVSDGTATATFNEIEHIVLGGGRDTILLADGSGSDTVQAFDLTDSGDGTTNDQLDVSGLTDAGGNPVNVADVTVTDTNGDGTGDAILTFPNGESITLVGVLAAQVDDAAELVAMGIPGLDYIVEGTAGGDLINGAYVGDPEGDMVDNNDAADGSNDDVIHGFGGDDIIDGGAGSNTMFGGAGNDQLYGGSNADSLDGGTGDDDLYSGLGDDTIVAGAGNDSIFASGGADLIDSGAGNDTIRFTDADTIDGGDGDDSIRADALSLDGSPVSVTGGELGETTGDTLSSGSYTGDVAVDLTAGGTGADPESGEMQLGTTTVSFSEIEAIETGAGNDSILGSQGDDSVSTGAGADTIAGGAGNDQIDVGAGDGADDLFVMSDGDGDDTLTGFKAPTDLGGGSYAGNDRLDVSGLTSDGGTTPVTAADVVVTDTNGDGTGDAILTFPGGESITLTGVAVSDASSDAQLVAMGIPATSGDYIVEGTAGGDLIDTAYVGDPEGDMIDNNDAADGSNDDYVEAMDGDDTVLSNVGNDSVLADLGNDSVDAGAGDDTVRGGFGNDTIIGGAGNDSLVGNEDDDSITGGIGSDSLYGELGNDVASGGDGNDTVEGNEGNDTLYGGAGDDWMRGSYDNDELWGGTGDDYLWGGWGDDVFYLEDNFGNDTVDAEGVAETGGDTLDLSNVTSGLTVDLTHVNPENGSVSDGTATATFNEIEHIVLGGGRDTILLADGSGSDTVQAFDLTDSGDGTTNDQLDVSGLTDAGGNPVNVADVTVTDTNGDGTGDAILTFPNGESITLVGVLAAQVDDAAELVAMGIPSNGAVDGTSGNDSMPVGYVDAEGDIIDGVDGLNDVIYGYGGNDTIVAGLGDDTVYGGTGNDTIDGGVGADQIDGGSGKDTILGASGNDTILGGDGNDIIYGQTGDDSLLGGGGDDTFALYDGGIGNDTIVGGETGETNGDDVEAFSVTSDLTVTFTGDEAGTLSDGTDTVTFSEIEQVNTGSGNDSIDASANGAGGEIWAGAGDDTFLGGSGNDVVFGFGGNDVIDGGAGADALDGDAGNDTIDGGAGNDTIIGDLGDDKIAGGAGADEIYGNEGNDSITAGEGDTVYGMDGDDLFLIEDTGDVGANNATIIGGEGAETLGDTLDFQGLTHWNDITYTNTDPGVGGGMSGFATLADGSVVSFSEIENVIICFTAGTRIATPAGLREVQDLAPGDMVVTRDHGLQPIRWAGQRTVPARGRLAPVRFQAGVLGNARDLLVSPQHRMLIQGPQASLNFGTTEVLATAKHLVDGGAVAQVAGGEVSYVHILFDQHEIVYAEGAPSESFFPGDSGLDAVNSAQREELFHLFPALRSQQGSYGQTARLCLKKHESSVLRLS